MKITKTQLRKIVRESAEMDDEVYEAGYRDAMQNRPHDSNPDMRDMDPRAYDYGFDKGTADRMDMQRPLGARGFYEGKVRIKKSDLQRIVKEELMSEVRTDADLEVDAMWDELFQALKNKSFGLDHGRERDEIYIMTGAAEGITVKIMRRGR